MASGSTPWAIQQGQAKSGAPQHAPPKRSRTPVNKWALRKCSHCHEVYEREYRIFATEACKGRHRPAIATDLFESRRHSAATTFVMRKARIRAGTGKPTAALSVLHRPRSGFLLDCAGRSESNCKKSGVLRRWKLKIDCCHRASSTGFCVGSRVLRTLRFSQP